MKKNKKQDTFKVQRSGVALAMIVAGLKGGPMKDRRTPRGGSKNDQDHYRRDGWE